MKSHFLDIKSISEQMMQICSVSGVSKCKVVQFSRIQCLKSGAVRFFRERTETFTQTSIGALIRDVKGRCITCFSAPLRLSWQNEPTKEIINDFII